MIKTILKGMFWCTVIGILILGFVYIGWLLTEQKQASNEVLKAYSEQQIILKDNQQKIQELLNKTPVVQEQQVIVIERNITREIIIYNTTIQPKSFYSYSGDAGSTGLQYYEEFPETMSLKEINDTWQENCIWVRKTNETQCFRRLE